MNRFVNEFEFTPSLMREAMEAWWNLQYRKVYITLLLISIAGVVLTVISRGKPTDIILIILPLVVILFIRRKGASQTAARISQLQSGQEGSMPRVRVVVNGGFVLEVAGQTGRISFEDCGFWTSTEHLFVISALDNQMIVLGRQSFLEGSETDFRQFLSQRISKRGR